MEPIPHRADTVCFACYGSGPNSVNHGEILLEYGMQFREIEKYVCHVQPDNLAFRWPLTYPTLQFFMLMNVVCALF